MNNKLKKLNSEYQSKLKKLQETCSHKWIADGYDVEGWRSVNCFKCIYCGKTKTDGPR